MKKIDRNLLDKIKKEREEKKLKQELIKKGNANTGIIER